MIKVHLCIESGSSLSPILVGLAVLIWVRSAFIHGGDNFPHPKGTKSGHSKSAEVIWTSGSTPSKPRPHTSINLNHRYSLLHALSSTVLYCTVLFYSQIEGTYILNKASRSDWLSGCLHLNIMYPVCYTWCRRPCGLPSALKVNSGGSGRWFERYKLRIKWTVGCCSSRTIPREIERERAALLSRSCKLGRSNAIPARKTSSLWMYQRTYTIAHVFHISMGMIMVQSTDISNTTFSSGP